MIVIESENISQLAQFATKIGISARISREHEFGMIEKPVTMFKIYLDENEVESLPNIYAQKALLAGTDT